MNKNVLKIIACLSMLIDHFGLMFYPNIVVFRAIGRLAMPIFAYCIGGGVLKTRNKLKYFLRVFILGVICQLFYIGDELVTNHEINEFSNSFHLNILLTFSLSIAICSAYVNFSESVERGDDAKRQAIYFLIFAISVIAALGLNVLFENSVKIFGYMVTLDYKIQGTLLPLFAVMIKDDGIKQKAIFTVGVIFFTAMCAMNYSYAYYALLSLPIIWLYNGKRGKLNLKYAFYLFYPIHLGALYLISIII